MTKFVFLAIFVCFLAYSSAKATPKDDDSNEEDFKKFAEQINEKFNTTILLDLIKMSQKVKEKCPTIDDKLESALEEMHQCITNVELGSDTFCSLIKKNYGKCTKPARDVIVACLPDESKVLPAMGEKMILAIIDQACKSSVEEILEIFNPCAMDEDNIETYPACKEIKTTFDEHKNQLPSKSLICHTLPKLRNCAKAVVDGSCKNPITKNVALKFHDAIEHSVKEDCATLNQA